MKNRILALVLVTVMLFSFALPVSAQDIINLTDYGEAGDAEAPTQPEPSEDTSETTDTATEPTDPPTEGESGPDNFGTIRPEVEATPTEAATEATTDPEEETESTEPEAPEGDSFLLDCTPEQAEKLIAFYEALTEQIENPPIRPYVSDGDSGSVSWTWGESVGIDVPSGDPGNPYHIGNIPRITLSTADMPIGRPFCAEFGPDPGGSYTASEGGDGDVLALLVAFEKGSASAVGVQLALWYLFDGIPLSSQPQAASALSAARSVDTTGYTYYEWSGSGQPFVTLDKAGDEPPDPTDPSGSEPTEPPTEPTNPNTRTEVTTDTETRTEIRQSTEYDYADGIGQITIAKRDQDGNSLDGAIFNIVVEFANGQRGGDSAFEIHNGSRLFTWTHPQDDYQPARVTVTEVRAPDGYIGDPTPKTAIVHPTYTRITRVMEHTITITTTTTTTSVIDIDTGEVLSESSASADAETELDPPTIQEYTDFIEGDRETVVTFVNQIRAAELVIFKYRTGTSVPLAGAQFEVSYVDPSVHSGRWTVTTGADGKATIALPKPGAVLIHEVNPPAGHIISPISGPDTTVTIYAGERKQVDIPNDPYTSITVTKIDSVTGEKLAGAEIRLKHITSGMEFKQTTGADGVALFEQVEPGSYYVEEIKAPNKYVLNSTRYPVQLRSGETASVTIPNDPYTAISVVKIDSVTGEPLAGATISLKHVTSGMELRLVTGADGIALFEQIEPGSYYVEEIKAPDRYVINTTRFPVELKSGEVASVTIPNDPYTGIQVTKIDANNGMKLAGAYIRLKHIASGQEYSGMTGEDGTVYFGKIPPGDYFVEEVQAPHGYVLNTTRYPLELRTGELATLTLPNYRKDGLYIRKVDQDGKPIPGAVFELRRGSGEVLLRETTDQNGLIYRGFLTTDTYIAEEISAPVGYLLDEKNPQDIYISEEDDNKEYTLTFVNKKKPSIEIIKVDAANPDIKLQGAVFRVSEQGGSKTWDVTTGFDGSAILENLEIGTTYLIEERTPASGYVNSGYRETIVLNECRVHTVTVENGKRPVLQIVKIDEATGQKLPGAVFRVARRGGSEYTDVTTGIDGAAELAVDPGWFIVSELRAPSGFVLDPTPREIEVLPGETAVLTVNNSRDPSLTLRKIDEQTLAGIEGVTLRVTKDGAAEYQDVTTGPDGTITLPLSPGWYLVQERVAKPGYSLDDTVHSIELKPGENSELVITNRRKPSLKIIKTCSVTGNPLQATFEVKVQNGRSLGTFTTDPETGELLIENLEYTSDPLILEITETIAPDGYIATTEPKVVSIAWGENKVIEWPNTPENPILIYKRDVDGNPIGDVEFLITTVNGAHAATVKTDGTSGVAVVPGLSPGWYSVKETRVGGEEYILNSTPKQVELKPGDPAVVEFINDRYPVLQILKLNKADHQPLPGVLVRVSYMDGAKIGDFRTDEQGIITLTADPGWVTVVEQETLDGFILDQTPVNVELKPNETATVELYNVPLPGLQIRKSDSVTGKPLAGVEYKLTRLDGSVIGNYTTDEQGVIYLDLDEPSVIITEIKTLDGYRLDDTPRTVELVPGELAVVSLENTPFPVLEIVKLDALTKEPLAGVSFKIFAADMRELGTFPTNSAGRIILTGMDEGKYFVQEVDASAAGPYILDKTVYEVELFYGKTTTIELFNTKMGTLRVKKIDAETGEPLAGAVYLLYDAQGNTLGEYTTDAYGVIELDSSMEPQKITLKEIIAPEGFVLDPTVHEVEIKAGETAELVLENEPERGRIQITKKAAEANPITKDKAGAALEGAEFEIVDEDENVVDTIVTDERGVGESGDLPLGRYAIRETAAPEFYLLDVQVFYADIKLHGDVVKFEVQNDPADIAVTVEKQGDEEVKAGEAVHYEFSNISNAGNAPLEEFYLHDALPAEVRLETLTTGTWSERLTYRVEYRTNKKTKYSLWADKLSTTVNNQLSVADLKLAKDEYVTDFKLIFGTVESGFHETESPTVTARMLEELENETRIVNKADAGGRIGDEWAYGTDSWVTVSQAGEKKCLPRTGF